MTKRINLIEILHVRVNHWEKGCYFIENTISSVGKTEDFEPEGHWFDSGGMHFFSFLMSNLQIF
jgi:hypothetical protein